MLIFAAMKHSAALILSISCAIAANASDLRQSMSLAGDWHMRYNTLVRDITLPGTTETNKVGNVSINPFETTHLSRIRAIEAQVEYSRDVVIPKSWRKKIITLKLERTKPTRVCVDGREVGSSTNISTSQIFDLTEALTVGTHTLSITVDNTRNAVPHQIVESSHAYSDDTQTNWNGIIGEISLTATDAVHVTSLRADADSIYVSTSAPCTVSLSVDGNPVGAVNVAGSTAVAYDSSDLQRWSEFNPALHTLKAVIKDKDDYQQTFGLCDFKTDGTHFTVNGRKTFLRGKHDACVFPKTAHTPMDVAEWQRYFSICKDYGINHVRFHSWCPPEAAFVAADSLGVYLQPELPFWGDFNADDEALMQFLHNEGVNIVRTYSHHPSFVMMALGNELWGSIERMEQFVKDFRKINPDILYTFGSNYYLGYKGANPAMDYFTTCRNGGEGWGEYNTHTRGSFSFCDAYDGGIINHFAPNSVMTLSSGVAGCNMPVISHETGQFQTYPDYAEITKYNGGVLRPYNLEVFKQRLKDAGMLQLANDFHRASGLWSVQLYKADIELDLRTRNLAGYQLLDLQDYPGQGSAYVGILDAFMDSKGITTSQEWRQWASPVVPLLSVPKFCYANNEHIVGEILLSNYGDKPLNGKDLTLYFGRLAAKYSIDGDSIGLSKVSDIDINLSSITHPQKLDLSINIEGTDYRNSYPLWVYPSQCELNTSGLVIATQLTPTVAEQLSNGASVLLMPDSTQYVDNTVGGLFTTDYWNYRMFKTICENNHKAVSPGTLGLLTNPDHPIFKSFPTDMHTSWQWFEVIKHSRPMILDGFDKEYLPTVQVIDNIERNHKLGLIFEFAVDRGKLLVVMSPLNSLLQHIEVRWLYKSILDYMHSSDFNPSHTVSFEQLAKTLNTATASQNISTLNNISY
jgi:hypothetical protein